MVGPRLFDPRSQEGDDKLPDSDDVCATVIRGNKHRASTCLQLTCNMRFVNYCNKRLNRTFV